MSKISFPQLVLIGNEFFSWNSILVRPHADILEYLFNLIETDRDYSIRFVFFVSVSISNYLLVMSRRKIVQHLCQHPPFRANQSSTLNTTKTVHRLWTLMKFVTLIDRTASIHCSFFVVILHTIIKFEMILLNSIS